ncbi:hypothetical protein QF037_005808 [Streptomyces canus]|uniref:hypothetical protein n=1 Tax=Streptomyces canus TaxID=58343 RepID=UPI0027894CE0|nr:hypothetical protein [Streptomyces canus]MDQ0601463.1 hypothetical protein [Streptomyces canus]
MTVTGIDTTPRSSIRARLMGVLLVLLSVVPAVGGWLVFSAWLPSDVERYQDYRAAEPCPDRSAARAAAEDCLLTVALTVERTRNEPGKRSGSYTATLDGAPVWSGTVSFGDPDPVLERLVPGDRITGTLWRGEVMTVGKGELRQNTSDAPRDEPQMTYAIGTFLGLLAALGLGFGAVRIARPLGHEPFTWRPLGKTLLIVMTVACAGVGLPAVWIGVPSWIVPVVVVPIVAVTAWQLHQHVRQTAARDRSPSSTEPTEPA